MSSSIFESRKQQRTVFCELRKRRIEDRRRFGREFRGKIIDAGEERVEEVAVECVFELLSTHHFLVVDCEEMTREIRCPLQV